MEVICAGIFIFLLVFIVIFAISVSRANKKRDAFFADFAVKNGWQSIPLGRHTPPKFISEKFGGDEANYSLLKYGDRREIIRAMSRQAGDKLYLVFDLKYTEIRSSKSTSDYQLTAIGLSAPNLSLPKFALIARGDAICWHAAVKKVHYPGSDMKDFINNQGIHPFLSCDDPTSLRITKSDAPPSKGMHAPITLNSQAFNERYILHGKKTDDIKRLFEKEKRSALELMPPTCVDGYGTNIFAFNAKYLVPTEKLQAFITEKTSVLDALIRESD